jgi:hypothetical protein
VRRHLAAASGVQHGEGFAIDTSVMALTLSPSRRRPVSFDWTEKRRQTRAVVEYLAALDEAAAPVPNRKGSKGHLAV